jgi:hypothetical protein
MTAYLDRLPTGWHVVTVCKATTGRTWDWAAFMIDTPPAPDHLRRTWDREAWVTIPGKHRTYAAACEALESAMATRH